MGASIRSSSAEETFALGVRLGSMLQARDVVVLEGDLGAGKTQLTKGIAQGLGVTDEITSPTFNILNIYSGERADLFHFDLYRLETSDELEDIGLYDMLGEDGVCILEWGERFADEIGHERLDIVFKQTSEDTREISFVAHGSRAEQIVDALASSAAEDFGV